VRQHKSGVHPVMIAGQSTTVCQCLGAATSTCGLVGDRAGGDPMPTWRGGDGLGVNGFGILGKAKAFFFCKGGPMAAGGFLAHSPHVTFQTNFLPSPQRGGDLYILALSGFVNKRGSAGRETA